MSSFWRTSASSSSPSETTSCGSTSLRIDSSLRGDDAFGLVADVEQHLVAVDLDDRARDDVAVVELDDRGVDRVGERLPSRSSNTTRLSAAADRRRRRRLRVGGRGFAGVGRLGLDCLGLRRCGDFGDCFRGRLVGRDPVVLGDGSFDCFRRVLLRQLCSSKRMGDQAPSVDRARVTGPGRGPTNQATGLTRYWRKCSGRRARSRISGSLERRPGAHGTGRA